jgi:hypothetical protein
MNLDGQLLKKIIKEIKQPTFEAKRKYRDMLAYKEQWNIYKYSVCCTVGDSEDDGVMAVIKGAQTVGRNIYRYAWSEVTFIPKVELANFAGATVDTSDNYAATIEDINDQPISVGNYPDGLNFSKFGNDFTPEVVGDISGEIFVYGSTCGITFENRNAVSRAIEKYLACGEDGLSAGITFNFHNDQYSPFIVVEKPNGASGKLDNYSGAYNLNEVLNRTIYDESEFPADVSADSISGPTGGVIFHQSDGGIRMPASRPGAADETDIILGPGINASKVYTDYPQGFASMPVGVYQRIRKNADGSVAESGSGSSIECVPIPMGHVVKIKSVSTKDLPSYGIDIRNPGVNKIFYFNATNAQDGDCTTLINCDIGDPP